MSLAEWLLWFTQAYAGLGVLVGIGFVLFGIGRVDHAAAGFRPLFSAVILPGCVVLWPLVLRRWMAARSSASSGET